MKIKEKQVKSVITKSNLPDADFVINPYIGCQHACIYCYADFMKRFTNHNHEDWGTFVDVKINASETIKNIKRDSLILFGSVTDPYQPVEAKYQITRKCLEKLLPFQPNIEILTKSPLILRDVDLLKKFKNLGVTISIGVFDEKLAKKLEPCVVSPKQRLETLKKLKAKGIMASLFISPIFPGISDVVKLIDSAKEFVDEILFENLNVRANNRKRIFKFLTENKPKLIPLYEEIQKDNSYWEKMRKEIIHKCENEKIKYKIYFYHNKKI